MDFISAKKLLDIQIENALRILSVGFGVNHAEATFFDTIQLLREEKTLKQYFLERVRSTFSMPDVGRLDSGMVPGDLIELVAHELRWAELLELASKRIEDCFHGNASLAVGDIAHNIANAYRDDWDGREFYRHYQSSRKGQSE